MSDMGNQNKWSSLVGEDENEDDEEDVHVCGGCKQQFTKIEIFVAHKRECKAKKRRKAAADSNSRVSIIVDLGKEVSSSKSVHCEVFNFKHVGFHGCDTNPQQE